MLLKVLIIFLFVFSARSSSPAVSFTDHVSSHDNFRGMVLQGLVSKNRPSSHISESFGHYYSK